MSRRPTAEEAFDALREWGTPLKDDERVQIAVECYRATKLSEGWSLQAVKDGIAAVWASALQRWGERKGGSSKGRIRKTEPPFVPWYAQGAPTFAEAPPDPRRVGTGVGRSNRSSEGAMAIPK